MKIAVETVNNRVIEVEVAGTDVEMTVYAANDHETPITSIRLDSEEGLALTEALKQATAIVRRRKYGK